MSLLVFTHDAAALYGFAWTSLHKPELLASTFTFFLAKMPNQRSCRGGRPSFVTGSLTLLDIPTITPHRHPRELLIATHGAAMAASQPTD
jgi:hypothetical protein